MRKIRRAGADMGLFSGEIGDIGFDLTAGEARLTAGEEGNALRRGRRRMSLIEGEGNLAGEMAR